MDEKDRGQGDIPELVKQGFMSKGFLLGFEEMSPESQKEYLEVLRARFLELQSKNRDVSRQKTIPEKIRRRFASGRFLDIPADFDRTGMSKPLAELVDAYRFNIAEYGQDALAHVCPPAFEFRKALRLAYPTANGSYCLNIVRFGGEVVERITAPSPTITTWKYIADRCTQAGERSYLSVEFNYRPKGGMDSSGYLRAAVVKWT